MSASSPSSSHAIGELRKARERVGMTTAQLAQRLGVNQSTVVRFEQSEVKGTVSLQTLERVATVLQHRLVYSLTVDAGLKGSRTAKVSSKAREISAKRGSSDVAAQLRVEELEIFRSMGPEKRLRRALELSDFVRKLKHV